MRSVSNSDISNTNHLSSLVHTKPFPRKKEQPLHAPVMEWLGKHLLTVHPTYLMIQSDLGSVFRLQACLNGCLCCAYHQVQVGIDLDLCFSVFGANLWSLSQRCIPDNSVYSRLVILAVSSHIRYCVVFLWSNALLLHICYGWCSVKKQLTCSVKKKKMSVYLNQFAS